MRSRRLLNDLAHLLPALLGVASLGVLAFAAMAEIAGYPPAIAAASLGFLVALVALGLQVLVTRAVPLPGVPTPLWAYLPPLGGALWYGSMVRPGLRRARALEEFSSISNRVASAPTPAAKPVSRMPPAQTVRLPPVAPDAGRMVTSPTTVSPAINVLEDDETRQLQDPLAGRFDDFVEDEAVEVSSIHTGGRIV